MRTHIETLLRLVGLDPFAEVLDKPTSQTQRFLLLCRPLYGAHN